MVHSFECMASISNTNEKTEHCSSQMVKEHLGHFLEGQSNKQRSESELDNTVWMTYSVKEDSTGLDM